METKNSNGSNKKRNHWKSWGRWLLVALIVAPVLALAIGAGISVAAPSIELGVFALRLPRIYIDVEKDGNWFMWGIPMNKIVSLFSPLDESQLRVPTGLIALAQANKLNQLEVVSDPRGAVAFINGKATPNIGWDEQSLANLGDLVDGLAPLLDEFGYGQYSHYSEYIQRLAPYLTRIQLDIVVDLPLAKGETRTPHRGKKEALPFAPFDPFLIVEDAEFKFHANLQLRPDGVPVVLGISIDEIEKDFNTSLYFLKLAPSTMEILDRADVRELAVRLNPGGIYLLWNGASLPSMTCTSEHIEGMNYLYSNAVEGTSYEGYLEVFSQLSDQLQSTDVQLSVVFP